MKISAWSKWARADKQEKRPGTGFRNNKRIMRWNYGEDGNANFVCLLFCNRLLISGACTLPVFGLHCVHEQNESSDRESGSESGAFGSLWRETELMNLENIPSRRLQPRAQLANVRYRKSGVGTSSPNSSWKCWRRLDGNTSMQSGANVRQRLILMRKTKKREKEKGDRGKKKREGKRHW